VNNTAAAGQMVIPLANYTGNFKSKCDLCRPSDFRILTTKGLLYNGTDVKIDPTTKSIIIDTRSPITKRFAIEAYFGNSSTTDCHFIQKQKYFMAVKVCGDEIIKVRDNSLAEINITMGIDSDMSFDLARLRSNFYITNYQQCTFKIFFAPNITVTPEALEKTPEPYDHFFRIDRNKGLVFLNHTNYNLTDTALKENSTIKLYLRA
jgi:hypothetical protein